MVISNHHGKNRGKMKPERKSQIKRSLDPLSGVEGAELRLLSPGQAVYSCEFLFYN